MTALSDIQNARRRSSSSRSGDLEGLGTGFGITTEAAVEQMKRNASSAERYAQQGVPDDGGFLSDLMGWGVKVFDLSGLDSLAWKFDTPRRLAQLGITDVTGLDTSKTGYDIQGADYRAQLGASPASVEERAQQIPRHAADAIFGTQRDTSGSVLLSLLGWQPQDNDNLPIGLEQVADVGRFVTSFGVDAVLDPFSYFGGGLSGLGKPAASKTAIAAMKRMATETTNELIQTGSVRAARELLEQGTEWTALKRMNAKAVIDAVEPLETAARKKGVEFDFAEAVQRASGIEDELGGIAFKEGVTVLNGQKPWGRSLEDILDVIQTKTFDSDNPSWRGWIELAQGDRRMMATTGGIRFGQATWTKEIPFVTDATRGMNRRIARAIRDTRPGRAVVESNPVRRVQPKWDDFMGRLSKDYVFKKKAATGRTASTLVDYYNVRYEYPNAIRDTLLSQESVLGGQAAAQPMTATLAAMRKRMVSEFGDDGVARTNAIYRSIGSGKLDPELLDGLSNESRLLARKLQEEVDEFYNATGRALLNFEDFRDVIRLDGTYRPLTWTSEFSQLMKEFTNLHRRNFPVLMNREQVEEFADELTKLAGVEVTADDVYLFRSALDTFSQRISTPRSFGHSPEMRMRRIGRAAVALTQDTVRFASLQEIDQSFVKTYRALMKRMELPESKLTRKLLSGDIPALELDPALQIEKYADSVMDAINEQAIKLAASKQSIIGRMQREVSPQLMYAEIAGDVAQRTLDVMEAVRRLTDEEIGGLGQILEDEVVEFTGGLKDLHLNPMLLEDPIIQHTVADLQLVWDRMRETKAEFPHLMRTEIERLKALYPTMPESMLESEAIHSLLKSFDNVQRRYIHNITMALARQRQELDMMFSSHGLTPQRAADLMDTMMAEQVASASQFIDAYRNQYVAQFSRQVAENPGPIPIAELLDSEAFRSSLLSRGDEIAEGFRTAADEAVRFRRAELQALELSGGSEIDIAWLEYQADVAERYQQALEGALSGTPMPSHQVTEILTPHTSIFDEGWNQGLGAQVRSTTHAYINLAERKALLDESEAALFLYDPDWAFDNEDTFRLLRHAVDGTPINAKVQPEKIGAWLESNLVQIMPGIWIPKTGDTRAPVMVVRYLSSDQSTVNNAMNFMQLQLRGNRASKLYVDTPPAAQPSYRFQLKRDMTLEELVDDETIKKAMPDIAGDTPRERRLRGERILETNGEKVDYPVQPTLKGVEPKRRGGTPDPASGRIRRERADGSTVYSRATQEGIQQEEALRASSPDYETVTARVRRKKAAGEPYRTTYDELSEEATASAFEFDPMTGQWNYVGDGGPDDYLAVSYPVLRLSPEKISELQAKYPSTWGELADEQYGWLDGSVGRARGWEDISHRANSLREAVVNDLRQILDDEIAAGEIADEYWARFNTDSTLGDTATGEAFTGQGPTGAPVIDTDYTSLGRVLDDFYQQTIYEARRVIDRSIPGVTGRKTVPRRVFRAGTQLEGPTKKLTWHRPLNAPVEELPEGSVRFESRRPAGPSEVIYKDGKPKMRMGSTKYGAGTVQRRTITGEIMTREKVRRKYETWFSEQDPVDAADSPTINRQWLQNRIKAQGSKLRSERPWYRPETRVRIERAPKGRTAPTPDGAVFIGRTGSGSKGTLLEGGFGNPYIPAEVWDRNPSSYEKWATRVADDAEAVESYRVALWEKIQSDPTFARKVADLSGRELFYVRRQGRAGFGSTVVPSHGDVLADAADLLYEAGFASETQTYRGLQRVESGGQIGPDELGLRVGQRLGYETGGVAPKGFMTSAGKGHHLPDLGLVEDAAHVPQGKGFAAAAYRSRTIQNVANTDGTIIFGDNIGSPGTKLTIDTAREQGKPFLVNPTPEQARAWYAKNRIRTVNIAGNRSFTDEARIEAVLAAGKDIGAETLEVSTRGDDFGKQFSALNATIDEAEAYAALSEYLRRHMNELRSQFDRRPESFKRFQAVEERYNEVREILERLDEEGSEPITIEKFYQQVVKQSGKGKPPKIGTMDVETIYTDLWRQWAGENPELMSQLGERVAQGAVLTDQFAREGTTSQARSLTRILEEQGITGPVSDAPTPRMPEAPTITTGRPHSKPPAANAKSTEMLDWLIEEDSYRLSLYEDGQSVELPRIEPDDFHESIDSRVERMMSGDEQVETLGRMTEDMFERGELRDMPLDDPTASVVTASWMAERDARAFAQDVTHRLLERSTRTGPDHLMDAHRSFLAKAFKNVADTYGTDQGFKDLVISAAGESVLPVNVDRIAANIRAIEAGWVEAMEDPDIVNFLTLRHLADVAAEADQSPVRFVRSLSDDELEQAREFVQGRFQKQMRAAQENLDLMATQLRNTGAAAKVEQLSLFVDDVKTAGRSGPLEDRAQAIEAIKTTWARDKTELQAIVTEVYGPRYRIGMSTRTDDGLPVVFIDTPESDRIFLEERFAGSFNDAVDALDRGEITKADALAWGIPQLADAADVKDYLRRQQLATAQVKEMASEATRAKAVADFYADLIDETQRAISQRNPNKLQRMVFERFDPSKKKGSGTYRPTRLYRDLLSSLNSQPEMRQWLSDFVDSALLAGTREFADDAFEAWWQRQRHFHASLEYSLETNITLLNRLSKQVADQQVAGYSVDELRRLGELAESQILRMMHIQSRLPYIGPEDPFIHGLASEREVGRYLAEMGLEAKADEILFLETAQQQVDVTIENLTRLMDDDVIGDLARKHDIWELKPGNLSRLRNQYEAIRQNPALAEYQPTIRGHVPAEDLGLGSGILANMSIDPDFAPLIEAMFKNSRSLYTPYSVANLSNFTKKLVNLWKAGATVARPSFHVRNLIGGVANGFIAGVGPKHYWDTFKDVQRFRRNLRNIAAGNVDIADLDSFDDLVFRGLDNPELFRAAWKENVLATSYTRAEHMYDPSAANTIKPWETNFYLYQWGGRSMETIEDHLRVAAFAAWWDPQDAGSSAVAKAAVNAVHFDYTDLTTMEEWVKVFMPFYVWTRRNIPLQFTQIIEQPAMLLWYDRARRNWNDQQLADVESIDPFTRLQAQQGFIMPFQRNNDQGFAQLLWNPQLPQYDLDVFPWQDGLTGFLTPTWLLGAATDQLGPGLSVPFQLSQMIDETGGTGTNAPTGLNAVLAALDAIGVYSGKAGYDPNSTLAPDVDYRIAKWANSVFSTLFPYWDDYRSALGFRPNNPYRAAKEGWLPGEDPGYDIPLRVMMGPVGRTVGRGLGFQWFTPTDAYFAAREDAQKLNDMRTFTRFEMGYSPQQQNQIDVEAILAQFSG